MTSLSSVCLLIAISSFPRTVSACSSDVSASYFAGRLAVSLPFRKLSRPAALAQLSLSPVLFLSCLGAILRRTPRKLFFYLTQIQKVVMIQECLVDGIWDCQCLQYSQRVNVSAYGVCRGCTKCEYGDPGKNTAQLVFVHLLKASTNICTSMWGPFAGTVHLWGQPQFKWHENVWTFSEPSHKNFLLKKLQFLGMILCK